MTAVVTVDDLQNALPGLSFDETTQPTAEQVQAYIDNVTGRVTAHLVGLGAGWPDAATDPTAASFVRDTVVDGALANTLSAMYALSTADGTPPSVERYRRQFDADLKELTVIVRGLQRQNPTRQGRSAPRVSLAPLAARIGGSFEQYTDARAYEEWRETVIVPWWRRFFVSP